MGEFGPHPITITEVYAYVQMTEIFGVDARCRFLATIRALDGVYLAHQAKAAKTSAGQASPAGG